ncbi:MAG: cupin domain-containing protein [Actinomycetes bacterium]
MGYHVIHPADVPWEERPNVEGQASRHTADITAAAHLQQSRARMWRIPAHTRGRRHKEGVQEEVFVVLGGTLTMLLGEPPERFDVEAGSVVSVDPGTGLQMRNESDDDVVVFAYGAPPVSGQAEYLDDVEL